MQRCKLPVKQVFEYYEVGDGERIEFDVVCTVHHPTICL